MLWIHHTIQEKSMRVWIKAPTAGVHTLGLRGSNHHSVHKSFEHLRRTAHFMLTPFCCSSCMKHLQKLGCENRKKHRLMKTQKGAIQRPGSNERGWEGGKNKMSIWRKIQNKAENKRSKPVFDILKWKHIQKFNYVMNSSHNQEKSMGFGSKLRWRGFTPWA